MNLSSSLKKIICFLMAVLMLVAATGCGETGTKKKIKKKKKVVVVVEENNDNTTNNNNNNNIIIDTNDGNDEDEYEAEPTFRPERPLPEVAEEKEEYVEPVVPEFDYEYKTLSLSEDYVIVYSYDEWKNRFEGKDSAGNGKAVGYTYNNRVVAEDLKDYFKDNYNLNLEVVKDTDAKAQSATKRILVGDTAYHKTTLTEQEFEVNVIGDDLVFEGGHFAMVEKAVKWFVTIDIEDGKVATLSGKADDFKSTVTLDNGITYTYVWGDEHDGNGIQDDGKWRQATHKNNNDITNVFNDERFQALENGRLRLTGDRYYDETNAAVGYAFSGSPMTDEDMLFRNGYVEFRARLPYARGAFPAIWTMSNEVALTKNVPNYNVDDGYGAYRNVVWTIEFDLFESFSDLDHMTTTVHKWYNGNLPDGSKRYEGYKDKETPYKLWILDLSTPDPNDKIDIYDKLAFPYYNANSSQMTCAYRAKYPGYNWEYYFEDPEVLNNEYHIYSFLYTSDYVEVSVDGNKFLEFDWDPNYDYKDGQDASNNNNGIGYNLWHYLIYDMMMYTPVNSGESQPLEKIVTNEDLPHNMYVDYVRIYQDLDDPSMALLFPAAQE